MMSTPKLPITASMDTSTKIQTSCAEPVRHPRRLHRRLCSPCFTVMGLGRETRWRTTCLRCGVRRIHNADRHIGNSRRPTMAMPASGENVGEYDRLTRNA